MLGHRKLAASEYLGILRRHKWKIIFPVILVPILAVLSTFFLPAKYMSQTLVIIEEQKVPDDYVKPVINSSLDSRLSSMKEQILSRSRIQPIIERYSLYPGMGMDDRIDQARKNIAIRTIQSQTRSASLPGFFISFTAGDPRTAQLVCGEITSLFVSENLRSREASAEGTTQFLQGQLNDAKRSLDEQDAKLADFQRRYIGKLPGQDASNLNMLTSLNTQLEAETQALARMEQDKSYQESMLAQQSEASAALAASPSLSATSALPATASPDQIEMRSLLQQEADLTSHYTADYPDVVAVRRKIADLRRSMAASAAPAVPGRPSSAPARIESQGVQQLRAQIRSAEIGIVEKRREQAQTESAIRTYQDRISSSPQVQEQYKELTRDYETANKFYSDLLTKMQHSKMATDLERRQGGEQFRVMDEPNLPDAPIFPNRVLFAAGGLVLGILIGLALAGFLEYRDTSLRNEQDIWAFTRLPTLAVIAYNDAAAGVAPRTGFFSRFRPQPKPAA